jgi:sugar/nucleoside kinase (ribokinase family)/D-arabinose 5-phosphate isomerase GutQ
MEKRFDLVGIGSMVVDMIYRTPRIIGSEEKISLQRYPSGEAVRKLVGGVALNHLSWASLLGLRVGIFGRQADDDHGRFLRDGMDRYHLDKQITLDGHASSFAHIFVDPEGGRAIYMSPAATSETTADYIREQHGDYIRGARMVSTEISQLPLDAVIAVLEIARESNVITALDVDIPRRDAISSLGSSEEFERALHLADYLKPSKAAVTEMTGETDALKAAQIIRARYGSRAVIITDGENGCAIASDDLNDRIPATPLTASDTTGAGDAFFGGMLAGLHFGLDWPETLKLANACGAACCEISGATPGETSLARVLELDPDARSIIPVRSSAAKTDTASNSAGADSSSQSAVETFLVTAREEIDKLNLRIGGAAYFQSAADLIVSAESRGARLHVTGIGKPSYVSGYIAALLSSIGTPAYFLDATECVHGSAGQVRPGDVVIAVSNSGETPELKSAVTTLRNNGALIIGVAGRDGSWLAQNSDSFLFAGVEREGSPLKLEPRASIMAEIYVLAALSVELQVRKKIDRSQYHSWHPGGAIGQATKKSD